MTLKKGFTLAELSIAAGLLSLVILAAFSVSSQSNKSFTSGSWRLNRQKEAQRFLLHFKENIESVSHLNKLTVGGKLERISTIPISVNSAFFNKGDSVQGKNIGLLFGSICTPYQEANPELGFNSNIKGKGRDLSLEVYKGRLALVITSRSSMTLSGAPADSQLDRTNTSIIDFNGNDSIFVLDDVASLSINFKEVEANTVLDTPESLITLTVSMSMPNSDNRVKVEESITARICDRAVSEFKPCGNVTSIPRKL